MKVLLAGNTGYVTEEFVEEAFPECQVMVLGNKMIKTVRRRELISRPFPRTELELGDIFRTYEFEAVVYFSNYLTLHGELEGEAENLRKILQYCRKGVQSHFLYVTGQRECMMYQQARLCWCKMQRMCADAMRDCTV